METLIDLRAYPVRNVLKLLLADKSTKKNILFATDAYDGTLPKTPITEAALLGFDAPAIQPRVMKSVDAQAARTRKKGEVFTPAWVCNKMNNHCDAEWFGRGNVFNVEYGETWMPTAGTIAFKDAKGWKKYVDSRRLEIACGEAPYIVSRYDAATGEPIDVERRIGILDRKLRVVHENTKDEKEWLAWATRAFQSVYGYEYQGDNLLIARINLLMTFVDNMRCRWNRLPTVSALRKLANVIVWNFWQMDSRTGATPIGAPPEDGVQLSLFDDLPADAHQAHPAPASALGHPWPSEDVPQGTPCKVYNWRSKKSMTFAEMKEGMMK